jgi:GrpB-like predicted nucleotidyltransferase (UPF0157 family)
VFEENAPMHDDALPGVPHGVVRLIPWTPRWTTLFEQEARLLQAALGPLALGLEHYGSTSVPGLPAKPILDILVGVRPPLDPTPYVAALAPLGYEYVPWAGVPEHLVFGRDEVRTHLVHLVEYGGSAWQRGLRFRDILRADPALRPHTRSSRWVWRWTTRPIGPATRRARRHSFESVLATGGPATA